LRMVFFMPPSLWTSGLADANPIYAGTVYIRIAGMFPQPYGK